MQIQELAGRVEELAALANHVPPAVLAARLVALVERELGPYAEASDLESLRERFEALREEPPREQPRPRVPLLRTEAAPPAPPEPPREQPRPARDPEVIQAWVERARVEEEAREALSSVAASVAASAATASAPTSAPVSAPARVEPRPEPRRSDPAPTDGAKKCNTCGEQKPLSEYYKAQGYKDGHRNDCKECVKADQRRRQREKREKAEQKATVLPPVRPPRPPHPAPKVEQRRFCARGRLCLAYPEIDSPSPLASDNKSDLCYRCEGARRKTVLDQVKQSRVRHPSAASAAIEEG